MYPLNRSQASVDPHERDGDGNPELNCKMLSSSLHQTGAGEVAQGLRVLAAIPEDLGSIPSNYMAAYNYL